MEDSIADLREARDRMDVSIDNLRRQVDELARHPVVEQETQRLLNELTNNAVRNTFARYEWGFLKLPVIRKRIRRTRRGTLFYVNPKGNRIFLNARQVAKCEEGRLPGAGDSCPPGT